jgi:hypothetical protein
MEIRGDIDALINHLKVEDDIIVIKNALALWKNKDVETAWNKGWQARHKMQVGLNKCKNLRIKNSILDCELDENEEKIIHLKKFIEFYYGVRDELISYARLPEDDEELDLYEPGDSKSSIIIDVMAIIDNRLGNIKPDRRILFSKDAEETRGL